MTIGHRLILICLLIAVPGTARAYIDPGTTSMFLQLVLGAVAGLLVVLQLYWRRVKGFFTDRKQDRTDSSGDSS